MVATRIPYVDLAKQHARIADELLEAARQVITSGQFVLGPDVERFEKQFAKICRVKHAIGVNSGTDAIMLALKAIDVGPGDEVITVPNSFIATVSAIVLAGARPVLVDVDESGDMNPERVEEAITNHTRALLPVHLTGRAADMDALCDIASRRGVKVVEDAAQAVAAEYRGRRVGSLGDVGCFSLHPLKTLNALGDGGVITTSDSAIHEKIMQLRNLGLASRDNAVAWSGNSRLDTIQAAFLMVKLDHLEEWTEQRRQRAAWYREELADCSSVILPMEGDNERSVYHTFVIEADQRDALKEFLNEQGIGTAIHYPVPVHLQDVGKGLGYEQGSFPVAEKRASRILSLPVYPRLKELDVRFIAQQIRAFYGE